MKELWKDIPGYEGYYQVSNYGRVKRLDRWVHTTKPHLLKERIMRPANQHGYRYVLFCVDGVRRTLQVHRLVLCSFTGKPLDYPYVVNHIDFDKSNNRLDNLEWTTINGNNAHFREKGGWRYDNWKRNVSNGKKGKPMPESQREFYRQLYKGERNPFYGKHHSQETKEKISEKKKSYYKEKRGRDTGVLH